MGQGGAVQERGVLETVDASGIGGGWGSLSVLQHVSCVTLNSHLEPQFPLWLRRENTHFEGL